MIEFFRLLMKEQKIESHELCKIISRYSISVGTQAIYNLNCSLTKPGDSVKCINIRIYKYQYKLYSINRHKIRLPKPISLNVYVTDKKEKRVYADIYLKMILK